MSRRFSHDALLILAICNWVPAIIVGVLIYWQASSNLSHLEQVHNQRLEQAQLALNSRLLSAKAFADIILVSRELSDFLAVDDLMRSMADNQLYGRVTATRDHATDIAKVAVLNRSQKPMFVYPLGTVMDLSALKSSDSGFILMDPDTVRYVRSIDLDDHLLPGPAAQLKGYLAIDIDLKPWRSTLAGPVKIKSIPSEPDATHLQLEMVHVDGPGIGEALVSLFILAFLVTVTTIFGWRLMRKRVVKPIRELTQYVSQQMDATPDASGKHEIVVLRESFERYLKYEQEMKDRLVEQSTFAAIGQTMQYLAHDIRRPFTMLKGVMHLIRHKGNDEIPVLVTTLAPEVDKAVQKVDDMMRNIMEVGSSHVLERHPVSLETLIHTTLCDVFQVYSVQGVRFRYHFNHSRVLSVDHIKITRVFCNIVQNALEAMDSKGDLWFASSNMHADLEPMVEVTIGNSGSYIAPENLSRLFVTNFTSGKRHGNGLGLMIVKKLVTEHGGTIRCTSSREHGTEFIFTLPTASISSSAQAPPLPVDSGELLATMRALDPYQTQGDPAVVERVINLVRQSGIPLRMLVADDEFVFRRAMEEHIEALHLDGCLVVEHAETAEEALSKVASKPHDVIVMDVEFGNGIDGFQAVRQLRTNGVKSFICIHSSGSPVEYQHPALAAGANLFLSKPMTRANLTNIIGAVVKEMSNIKCNVAVGGHG